MLISTPPTAELRLTCMKSIGNSCIGTVVAMRQVNGITFLYLFFKLVHVWSIGPLAGLLRRVLMSLFLVKLLEQLTGSGKGVLIPHSRSFFTRILHPELLSSGYPE